MAEVLITLGVIGVVAALTLPGLIQNYQKKTYVEGLKVAYSTLNQAMKAAIAADGVEKIQDTTLFKKCEWKDLSHDEDGNFSDNIDVVACEKEFGKYLKNLEYLSASDMRNEMGGYEGPTSFTGADCSKERMGKYAWFYLDDKNKCEMQRTGTFRFLNSMVADIGFKDFGYYYGLIYVDINGQKGPNILGRDAHYFVVLEDGSVEPWYGVRRAKATAKYRNKPLEEMTYYGNPSQSDSELDAKYCNANQCSASTSGAACGKHCASKIIYEGWQMNY